MVSGVSRVGLFVIWLSLCIVSMWLDLGMRKSRLIFGLVMMLVKLFVMWLFG